ncbi:MAG: phage tail tube protein [Syntrophobacteraceae bacterium]
MLTRKTVILAKIESSYGADPAPTPAANALLVSDVDVRPAGEAIQRDYVRGSLGQVPFIRGVRSVEVSFRTELKGTGSRGSLPSFGWEGPLFRACGMSETVTAATSIVYAPVSSGFESVALYVYRDGIFHKTLGCRGTFRINLEAGRFPVVEWKFYGLYASPADASPAAQTFSGVNPAPILAAALSIGGYSPIAERIELDIDNRITARKSLNSASGIAGFEITGRTPRGSFDPEAVAESTCPFWSRWENAAAQPLAIGPIGAAPGNILSIAAPKVQYREIDYGDRDGLLTYRVPFALAMNSGDDELTITIT